MPTNNTITEIIMDVKPSLTTYCLAVSAASIGLYLTQHYLSRRRYKEIPGPPPLPLIGNVFDMPTEREWETYAKWSQKYGDIVKFTVLGQDIIILRGMDNIISLLDKKAGSCSDRIQYPIIKLAGWNDGIAWMQAKDPEFRFQRKLFQQVIGTPTSVRQFDEIQQMEMKKMVKRLAGSTTSDSVLDVIRNTVGTIMFRISYGYHAKEDNDYFIQLGEGILAALSIAISPTSFLVNFLPWMKYIPEWMPGASFKRMSREWREQWGACKDLPLKFSLEQMANGTAEPSLASKLLDGNQNDPNFINSVKLNLSSYFIAGIDTTNLTIRVFLKAMVLYPDVQRKAQEEFTRVLGPNQIPTTADRTRLPYFNALITELFRWHTAGPLSVPHCTAEDVEFNGYLIKKGSLIMPSIWVATRDPAMYHDPLEFKPERYLATPDRGAECDPRTLVFGFGRRTCPGKVLADSTLFIACAMILSVFQISPHLENGVPVLPENGLMPGFVSYPSPFKFAITVRSREALETIRNQV